MGITCLAQDSSIAAGLVVLRWAVNRLYPESCRQTRTSQIGPRVLIAHSHPLRDGHRKQDARPFGSCATSRGSRDRAMALVDALRSW
jgi:hypothetical protein